MKLITPVTPVMLVKLVMALVAVMLMPLAACSTDPSPSPGIADPTPPPGNNPAITVLDPNLQKGIGFGTATVIPAGEGPMKVQIECRNLTNYEYLIDYRFLFYDANNMQLEPVMGWRGPVSLLPKQLQMLSANSLDNTARSYRLEVKWSR